MAPRTCPRCRLINDAEAERCDCGHEFATGALRTPRAVEVANARIQHLTQPERRAIADTADVYRSLVLVVFAQALVGGGSRVAARMARGQGEPETLLLVSLGSLVLLIAMAVVGARKAYVAAEGMSFASPASWAVLVLFGGILGVIVMNGRAREWAARHNIGFGLLGPRLADIDRLVARGERER